MKALVAVLALVVVVAPAAAAQEGAVGLSIRLGGFAPDTTAAGAPRSLDLEVDNMGSTVGATGVVVTLTMPPGGQVLSTPASVCPPGAGTITCPIGTIGPFSGSSRQIPIQFDEVGVFEVVASISADQPDIDNSDNTASFSFVVVEEQADLAAQDRRERALTGTSHTVTHLIWNRGPTHAGGASIEGSFPSGVEMVPGSLVVRQGFRNVADQCTIAATGFTCDSVFDMIPNAGNEVSYDLVMPDEPATLELSITVSGRNDPDPSNDTGTVTLDVGTPAAELRTDLILFGPLLAGEPADTTMWTWNTGDGEAADVVATINAPAGWALAPPSKPDPGRSCSVAPDATAVTCTYDSIGPNTRRDIELRLTPPAGSGTGTVTVAAQTPTPEIGTYPNTDAKTVRYAPAGLDIVAVSAVHDPDTPRARMPERSTVTWTFRNATPERLSDGIDFSVQIPDGAAATFLSARALEPGGGSSGSNCNVEEGDQHPSCRLDTRELGDIEVTLDVVYDTGGTYTFTATALSDGEQSPGDETLSHTVVVDPSASDLTIRTELRSSEVTSGDVLTYTATVTNDGPDAASEVMVTDQFPADVEVVSATIGWFSRPCDIVQGGAFLCRPGYLAPGAASFVTVTVRPTTAGPLTIDPTVAGLQEDPDESSNTDPVQVDVVEPGNESAVDLQLSWQESGPFAAGETLAVVALVDVPGSRAATDVELDVSGLDNLEVVSSAHGWFGRPCDGPTTCTIPVVRSRNFGFVVLQVRPLAPGPISAELTITGAQPDPDPSNNTVMIVGVAA